MLAQRASMLGLDIQLDLFDPTQPPQPQRAGRLNVLPVPLANHCVPGQLDPGNARYVLETLRLGGQGCLDGHFAAVVTAPRSEEHTSELQSRPHLVCRLLLEKKKLGSRLPYHRRAARDLN